MSSELRVIVMIFVFYVTYGFITLSYNDIALTWSFSDIVNALKTVISFDYGIPFLNIVVNGVFIISIAYTLYKLLPFT